MNKLTLLALALSLAALALGSPLSERPAATSTQAPDTVVLEELAEPEALERLEKSLDGGRRAHFERDDRRIECERAAREAQIKRRTEEQANCPVCMEPLKSSAQGGKLADGEFDLKCGHVFHENCLKRWFEQQVRQGSQSITCPYCRDVILDRSEPSTARPYRKYSVC